MKRRLLTCLSDNHLEHDYCYNHLACQHGLCYEHALWNYYHFYLGTACGDNNLYFYSHLEPAGRRNSNYRWSDADAGWIHPDADFDLYGRRIYATSFDGLDYDHSRSQHSDFDEYSSSTNDHSAAVHGFDYDDPRSQHFDFDHYSRSTNDYSTAVYALDYNHARCKHFGPHKHDSRDVHASCFYNLAYDDSGRKYLDSDKHAATTNNYPSCFDDFAYDNSRCKHPYFDEHVSTTNDYPAGIYDLDHNNARSKYFNPHQHDPTANDHAASFNCLDYFYPRC
jgi:hypothetical protein